MGDGYGVFRGSAIVVVVLATVVSIAVPSGKVSLPDVPPSIAVTVTRTSNGPNDLNEWRRQLRIQI